MQGLAAAGSDVEAGDSWGKRRSWNEIEMYLARIYPLTAEGIVVGTHDGGR